MKIWELCFFSSSSEKFLRLRHQFELFSFLRSVLWLVVYTFKLIFEHRIKKEGRKESLCLEDLKKVSNFHWFILRELHEKYKIFCSITRWSRKLLSYRFCDSHCKNIWIDNLWKTSTFCRSAIFRIFYINKVRVGWKQIEKLTSRGGRLFGTLEYFKSSEKCFLLEGWLGVSLT